MFQIIVKEKGVFTNVTSPSTKAKLRILFEVAPLALLVRPRSRGFVGPPLQRSPSTRRRNASTVIAPACHATFCAPRAAC